MLFLFLGLVMSQARRSDEQIFKEFQETYGKKYTSEREMKFRFEIFKSNLMIFEEVPTIVSSSGKVLLGSGETKTSRPFEIGVNEFADLSKEEFASYYLLPENSLYVDSEFQKHGRDASSPRPAPRKLEVSLSDPASLITRSQRFLQSSLTSRLRGVPKRVNWAEKGTVSPVKNQKHCNACFIFAATAVIEARASQKLGKTSPLSEQEIIDCGYPNNDCKGGQPSAAMQYVVDSGVAFEEDYPYVAEKGPTCKVKTKKRLLGTSRSLLVTQPQEDETDLDFDSPSDFESFSPIPLNSFPILENRYPEPEEHTNSNVQIITPGRPGTYYFPPLFKPDFSTPMPSTTSKTNSSENSKNSPATNSSSSKKEKKSSGFSKIASKFSITSPKKFFKKKIAAFKPRPQPPSKPVKPIKRNSSKKPRVTPPTKKPILSLPPKPSKPTPTKPLQPIPNTGNPSRPVPSKPPVPSPKPPTKPPANPVPSGRFTKLKNYRFLNQDIQDLILELVNGPILAVQYVSSQLKFYKSGIFNGEGCAGVRKANHAVLIVGYDLEHPIPHFVIKNSWGPDWGDKGFFRMAIGDFKLKEGLCLVAATSFNLVPEFE